MSKQRSRRGFLAGVGAVGLAGLGGCTAVSGGPEPVSLLVAGSLADAVEHGLREAVDRPLRAEAYGSAQVARLVAEGQKEPDIVSLADVALFDGPLSPRWYATFATTSLVVAYTTETEGGRRVADAGRDGWYRALADERVRLGRTDPDLDPLGYRTLFLLELASDYYDDAGALRETVPERGQIYPETQLLSQFETGGVDAAVTYRSIAAARGFDYVDLPAEIDLGDPAHADRYATPSYELPGGKTVQGAPIVYGSTMRTDSKAVRSVFERHTRGGYLREFGFAVPGPLPRYTGDVPTGVRR